MLFVFYQPSSCSKNNCAHLFSFLTTEPQEDHALIMVRFAQACMYKSYELTKRLEITLGPDTGELSMRFGLHSGPVIAGVLRGYDLLI